MAAAEENLNPALMTLEADYYGVPIFLMKDYLGRVGAVEGPELHFSGEGWRAQVFQAPWRQIGSLRVGGATVHFSGDADLLQAMLDRLHLMTQRGGG